MNSSRKLKKASTKSSEPVTPKKKGRGTVKYVQRNLYAGQEEVHGKPVGLYLKRMIDHEADGFFRSTMFGTDIIWYGRKYHFSKPRYKTSSKKNLNLFKRVKNDALKYLKSNKIKKLDTKESTHTNKNFKFKKGVIIACADLDSAYWTIARRLGIVSDETYKKAILLPDNQKDLGLACLSSLGAEKPYQKIIKGQITNHRVIVKGNEKLQEVYKLIRFTCFKYMKSLARKLGTASYVKYETDCIFFVYNKENINTVKAFMEKHDLDFKYGIEKDYKEKLLEVIKK